MRSITRTVAPTQTPVSLDELKSRLRIAGNEFDSELMMYLDAATDYCQEYQWAQFCTATFVERYDRFPCRFELMRNPVSSVSSITYVDSGSTVITLTADTDYTVDIYSKPCRIVPAYTKSWPATRGHINDVVVTYVAGYGTNEDVPDEIRQAIIIKVSQLYEACGDQKSVDMAIHSLLDKRSFRVFY